MCKCLEISLPVFLKLFASHRCPTGSGVTRYILGTWTRHSNGYIIFNGFGILYPKFGMKGIMLFCNCGLTWISGFQNPGKKRRKVQNFRYENFGNLMILVLISVYIFKELV